VYEVGNKTISYKGYFNHIDITIIMFRGLGEILDGDELYDEWFLL
jgi:hypothetical protein